MIYLNTDDIEKLNRIRKETRYNKVVLDSLGIKFLYRGIVVSKQEIIHWDRYLREVSSFVSIPRMYSGSWFESVDEAYDWVLQLAEDDRFVIILEATFTDQMNSFVWIPGNSIVLNQVGLVRAEGICWKDLYQKTSRWEIL